MTRLVIITLAALTLSGVAASAQTRSDSTKAYTDRAPGYSQTYYAGMPLVYGVAY
ncbi:MAG TPA: hypothetical protein VH206_01185 [Xanthobacteraceae bacterium]|jgi:hypothetical protein|nr:hypothetical protein [Xanthobacteraceae bacterium]